MKAYTQVLLVVHASQSTAANSWCGVWMSLHASRKEKTVPLQVQSVCWSFLCSALTMQPSQVRRSTLCIFGAGRHSQGAGRRGQETAAGRLVPAGLYPWQGGERRPAMGDKRHGPGSSLTMLLAGRSKCKLPDLPGPFHKHKQKWSDTEDLHVLKIMSTLHGISQVSNEIPLILICIYICTQDLQSTHTHTHKQSWYCTRNSNVTIMQKADSPWSLGKTDGSKNQYTYSSWGILGNVFLKCWLCCLELNFIFPWSAKGFLCTCSPTPFPELVFNSVF